MSPGDLAVDLTAGRGRDTLALWQLVGQAGQVIAFDVQAAALEVTQQCLLDAGAPVRIASEGHLPVPLQSGIDLIGVCHSRYSEVVSTAPAAIIANLGYLPGGNQELVTQPETTVAALEQALESLVMGGRLAVVVYPGHAGGQIEATRVGELFSGLDNSMFDVLQCLLCNRYQAPGLFVAEKRTGVGRGRC